MPSSPHKPPDLPPADQSSDLKSVSGPLDALQKVSRFREDWDEVRLCWHNLRPGIPDYSQPDPKSHLPELRNFLFGVEGGVTNQNEFEEGEGWAPTFARLCVCGKPLRENAEAKYPLCAKCREKYGPRELWPTTMDEWMLIYVHMGEDEATKDKRWDLKARSWPEEEAGDERSEMGASEDEGSIPLEPFEGDDRLGKGDRKFNPHEPAWGTTPGRRAKSWRVMSDRNPGAEEALIINEDELYQYLRSSYHKFQTMEDALTFVVPAEDWPEHGELAARKYSVRAIADFLGISRAATQRRVERSREIKELAAKGPILNRTNLG